MSNQKVRKIFYVIKENNQRKGTNPFVLSLLAQRKDERKGTPVNPPYGFVRSFGRSRPRLNSLRSTPLRQTPLSPGFFFSRSPGSKEDKNKKQEQTPILSDLSQDLSFFTRTGTLTRITHEGMI
jgi:hypothetical protein